MPDPKPKRLPRDNNAAHDTLTVTPAASTGETPPPTEQAPPGGELAPTGAPRGAGLAAVTGLLLLVGGGLLLWRSRHP